MAALGRVGRLCPAPSPVPVGIGAVVEFGQVGQVCPLPPPYLWGLAWWRRLAGLIGCVPCPLPPPSNHHPLLSPRTCGGWHGGGVWPGWSAARGPRTRRTVRRARPTRAASWVHPPRTAAPAPCGPPAADGERRQYTDSSVPTLTRSSITQVGNGRRHPVMAYVTVHFFIVIGSPRNLNVP